METLQSAKEMDVRASQALFARGQDFSEGLEGRRVAGLPKAPKTRRPEAIKLALPP